MRKSRRSSKRSLNKIIHHSIHATSWVTIAVLLCVFALAYLGPRAIDFSYLKPQIEERINEKTALKATIKGPIRLSLLPRVRLHVNNVDLENGLKIKKVYIKTSVSKLIKGEVSLKQIRFYEPTIKLETLKLSDDFWDKMEQLHFEKATIILNSKTTLQDVSFSAYRTDNKIAFTGDMIIDHAMMGFKGYIDENKNGILKTTTNFGYNASIITDGKIDLMGSTYVGRFKFSGSKLTKNFSDLEKIFEKNKLNKVVATGDFSMSDKGFSITKTHLNSQYVKGMMDIKWFWDNPQISKVEANFTQLSLELGLKKAGDLYNYLRLADLDIVAERFGKFGQQKLILETDTNGVSTSIKELIIQDQNEMMRLTGVLNKENTISGMASIMSKKSIFDKPINMQGHLSYKDGLIDLQESAVVIGDTSLFGGVQINTNTNTIVFNLTSNLVDVDAWEKSNWKKAAGQYTFDGKLNAAQLLINQTVWTEALINAKVDGNAIQITSAVAQTPDDKIKVSGIIDTTIDQPIYKNLKLSGKSNDFMILNQLSENQLPNILKVLKGQGGQWEAEFNGTKEELDLSLSVKTPRTVVELNGMINGSDYEYLMNISDKSADVVLGNMGYDFMKWKSDEAIDISGELIKKGNYTTLKDASILWGTSLINGTIEQIPVPGGTSHYTRLTLATDDLDIDSMLDGPVFEVDIYSTKEIPVLKMLNTNKVVVSLTASNGTYKEKRMKNMNMYLNSLDRDHQMNIAFATEEEGVFQLKVKEKGLIYEGVIEMKNYPLKNWVFKTRDPNLYAETASGEIVFKTTGIGGYHLWSNMEADLNLQLENAVFNGASVQQAIDNVYGLKLVNQNNIYNAMVSGLKTGQTALNAINVKGRAEKGELKLDPILLTGENVRGQANIKMIPLKKEFHINAAVDIDQLAESPVRVLWSDNGTVFSHNKKVEVKGLQQINKNYLTHQLKLKRQNDSLNNEIYTPE